MSESTERLASILDHHADCRSVVTVVTVRSDIYAAATRLRKQEARIAFLERAIRQVLADEESRPGAWGPDVTCVATLRDALDGKPWIDPKTGKRIVVE